MRALLSVSDKRGIVDFARMLSRLGVEIISTGGTARALEAAGVTATDVASITGMPEMLDGRVKTLHPAVHGGLLALRHSAAHQATVLAQGITPIDILVVNLYPFAETIATPDVTFGEAIENIDIGGPAMIRSAAKNHADVLVLTSPDQYPQVAAALEAGTVTSEMRLKLAQQAFAHTAAYDAHIASYLAGTALPAAAGSPVPDFAALKFARSLRYGENPHQRAALYTGGRPAEASVAFAEQLHGKELSYINLLDADAALAAVKEFDTPAACIVKHATPCGLAIGASAHEAFAKAYSGDPLAAFGGIVALNRLVDLAAAQAITAIDKLLEVIVAPGFAEDALALLKSRWKNCRLLATGPLGDSDPAEYAAHKITGGLLVQSRDLPGDDESVWKVASDRAPTAAESADLRFAWRACKHIKSNAIAIAHGGMLLGAGAGQMDRMTASRLAVEKAATRAPGAVAASDAFFPFPDGPELLLKAGITALIHPGGSLRDHETTALANAYNAAIILTGTRHFRH